MARVTIRIWNADGYHKDVAIISEEQVHMHSGNEMEAKGRHIMAPPTNAVRLVVDPKQFPEAVEFEVIVEK